MLLLPRQNQLAQTLNLRTPMRANFPVVLRQCRLIMTRFGVTLIVGMALCLTTHCAIGQATASLQGTIKDPSGAVVPNAEIIAHNLATGEERKTTSNSAGIYELPSLPI